MQSTSCSCLVKRFTHQNYKVKGHRSQWQSCQESPGVSGAEPSPYPLPVGEGKGEAFSSNPKTHEPQPHPIGPQASAFGVLTSLELRLQEAQSHHLPHAQFLELI